MLIFESLGQGRLELAGATGNDTNPLAERREYGMA